MTKKREDDRMNTNKSTKHNIHKNKSEKKLGSKCRWPDGVERGPQIPTTLQPTPTVIAP